MTTTTSSSSLSNDRNEHMFCAVCMEVFDEPRVLRCGHSICTRCVENFIAYNARSNGTARDQEPTSNPNTNVDRGTVTLLCAHCSQMTSLALASGVNDLPLNRNFAPSCTEFRNAAVEGPSGHQCVECESDAQFFCSDCGVNYCRAHWTSNHRFGALKNHQKLLVGMPKIVDRTCQVAGHTGECFTFYCRTCEMLVCQMCIFQNLHPHETHDMITMKMYEPVAKAKVASRVEEAEAWIEKAIERREAIDQTAASVDNAHVELRDLMDAACAAVIATAQSRRDSLIEESSRIRAAKMTGLDAQKVHIEQGINIAQVMIGSASEVSRMTGHQVIQLAEHVRDELKRLPTDAQMKLVILPQVKIQTEPQVVVQAINAMGSIKSAELPLPPAGVRIDLVSTTNVTVYWTARPNETVKLFLRKRNETPQQLNLADGSVSQCKITGLERDTEYSVALVAENEYGASDPSGQTSCRTLAIVKSFEYQRDWDKNGLFYWLGTSHGNQPYTNPTASGIIVASSSQPEVGCQDFANNAAGRDFMFGNATKGGVVGNWVMFDLKNHHLIPDRYSLRHDEHGAIHHLRNWKLEASINGTTWDVLRAHKNDTAINGKYAVATWTVKSQTAYSKFRITTTGKNSVDQYHLLCSGFEVYGKLMSM